MKTVDLFGSALEPAFPTPGNHKSSITAIENSKHTLVPILNAARPNNDSVAAGGGRVRCFSSVDAVGLCGICDSRISE